MKITVRDANDIDGEKLQALWVVSLHKDNLDCFFQPWEVYQQEQNARIEDIISRDSTYTLVASDHLDTSLLLGFLCFEVDTNGTKLIHYCCVDRPFQKQGIAKLLLATAGIDIKQPIKCTSVTQVLYKLRKKYRFILVKDTPTQTNESISS